MAVSLGLVSFFVVLPASVALILLWGFVLFWGSAHSLDAVGALQPSAFSGTVYLTGTLLALSAAVWAAGGLASAGRWARRRAARAPAARAPTAVPPRVRRGPRGTWAARHPWLAAAFVCGLVDVVLLPIDRARIVDVPDGVVGAGILGAAVLAELGLIFALSWGVRAVLRATWRLTRRSPFAAGAVSAGSLAATLSAYFLGSALGVLAATLPPPAAPPRPVRCTRSSLECSRELFARAVRPPRLEHATTAALTPVLAPPQRPRDAFGECVEELYRDDPRRGNAYRDALVAAQRRVRDSEEAKDVVHATLITVCEIAERIRDIRSFFIRSVKNNAGKAARRARRSCALVPEVPNWPPDQCVARSVEQQYVQSEMEAAMHDAFCSLDGTNRRVIHLRVWQNLSHGEIGRQLGWSEATARQRYRRALDALQAAFQQRCR